MISKRNILLSSLLIATSACATAPQTSAPPVFIPPSKPVSRPAPAPRPSPGLRAPLGMVEAIRSLWASYPDRAGIAVIRDGASWSIEHRGQEAMPQQSVSKLWVAITVLDAIDRGALSLDEPVTLTKADLTVFSRSAEQMIGPDGWNTTIRDLLERQLTKSDNTANDFLLKKVGGTAAVRAMLLAKGLSGIKFGGAEHILQSGTAGLTWREEYRGGQAFQAARAKLSDVARKAAMDAYTANPPDGATPMGIARALLRLKRGELLSSRSTAFMLGQMAASETGKQRLRAGVPFDWQFAHKTGTGQDFQGRTAGYNDVGLITAPDGTTYAVVIQIADTTQRVPARMEFMQGIAAAVTANHGM